MTRFARPLSEQAPPPAHLSEIARRLAAEYLPEHRQGAPRPSRSREPLDGVIETILSQQNTAPITRRQFVALKEAYPRWEAALADGPDGIEGVLKAAGGGLSRLKAGYIHAALSHLEEAHGHLSLRAVHDLPDAEVRALLEGMPGVGMRTASCVLLFDLARPAMPVDTHIWRLAQRLELTPPTWNAVKVERWFDEVLPRDWEARYTFHVSAIRHGRATCRARHPRCDVCVLRGLCPSAALLGPAAMLGP
ncbi:Fe-S cluster assembly protein HesB [Deinococcus koreensis]|uniref:Fe-S cluster assembly protein HesB n=1 Tax=Deinococcus koreensis TaxID=2054903 RepID=A0A2K3V1X2_9DEIO|nr:Fe-S cluster assembly protein HesB [Deinococcus koreensis]